MAREVSVYLQAPLSSWCIIGNCEGWFLECVWCNIFLLLFPDAGVYGLSLEPANCPGNVAKLVCCFLCFCLHWHYTNIAALPLFFLFVPFVGFFSFLFCAAFWWPRRLRYPCGFPSLSCSSFSMMTFVVSSVLSLSLSSCWWVLGCSSSCWIWVSSSSAGCV